MSYSGTIVSNPWAFVRKCIFQSTYRECTISNAHVLNQYILMVAYRKPRRVIKVAQARQKVENASHPVSGEDNNQTWGWARKGFDVKDYQIQNHIFAKSRKSQKQIITAVHYLIFGWVFGGHPHCSTSTTKLFDAACRTALQTQMRVE